MLEISVLIGFLVIFAAAYYHAKKKREKVRFRNWAKSEEWKRSRGPTRNDPR
jgi:hypothetical protein